MNIGTVFDDLVADGLDLRVNSEGRLAVSPVDVITDDHGSVIRAHRDDLVAWLTPLQRCGPQAAADAAILSEILRNYPCIGLAETKRLCAERGLPVHRFPAACVAPPPIDSPADLGAIS